MQHRWLILKLDNVGQALNNSQSGCIRCTIRGAQRRELYIMQGDIYIYIYIGASDHTSTGLPECCSRAMRFSMIDHV